MKEMLLSFCQEWFFFKSYKTFLSFFTHPLSKASGFSGVEKEWFILDDLCSGCD